jgi:hypothetical protein
MLHGPRLGVKLLIKQGKFGSVESDPPVLSLGRCRVA